MEGMGIRVAGTSVFFDGDFSQRASASCLALPDQTTAGADLKERCASGKRVSFELFSRCSQDRRRFSAGADVFQKLHLRIHLFLIRLTPAPRAPHQPSLQPTGVGLAPDRLTVQA